MRLVFVCVFATLFSMPQGGMKNLCRLFITQTIEHSPVDQQHTDVTLKFSLPTNCPEIQRNVLFVSVSVDGPPPSPDICLTFKDKACNHTANCGCNWKTGEFSARRRVQQAHPEIWKLTAKLNDGGAFSTDKYIKVFQSQSASAFTPETTQIASDTISANKDAEDDSAGTSPVSTTSSETTQPSGFSATVLVAATVGAAGAVLLINLTILICKKTLRKGQSRSQQQATRQDRTVVDPRISQQSGVFDNPENHIYWRIDSSTSSDLSFSNFHSLPDIWTLSQDNISTASAPYARPVPEEEWESPSRLNQNPKKRKFGNRSAAHSSSVPHLPQETDGYIPMGMSSPLAATNKSVDSSAVQLLPQRADCQILCGSTLTNTNAFGNPLLARLLPRRSSINSKMTAAYLPHEFVQQHVRINTGNVQEDATALPGSPQPSSLQKPLSGSVFSRSHENASDFQGFSSSEQEIPDDELQLLSLKQSPASALHIPCPAVMPGGHSKIRSPCSNSHDNAQSKATPVASVYLSEDDLLRFKRSATLAFSGHKAPKLQQKDEAYTQRSAEITLAKYSKCKENIYENENIRENSRKGETWSPRTNQARPFKLGEVVPYDPTGDHYTESPTSDSRDYVAYDPSPILAPVKNTQNENRQPFNAHNEDLKLVSSKQTTLREGGRDPDNTPKSLENQAPQTHLQGYFHTNLYENQEAFGSASNAPSSEVEDP